MKVKIGDMEFNQEDFHSDSHGRAVIADKVIRERFDAWLCVAEKCYIERHGLKPERSTVEEF